MTEKLWSGRFAENTAKIVEKFTSSINIDKRLNAYDIAGSIAHCKMLAKQSIISEDEASILIKGLKAIKTEIEDESFLFDDQLEDIHMHIEARLKEITGPVSGKLHTARSRNDQVALDVRMYLKDENQNIVILLTELCQVLINLAKNNIDVILPGYTHLQRAQPVLLSHHFMAYFEMFKRDANRFIDSFKRIDVMPLGAAALAGTTYPIDRKYVAELLGFSQVSKNSMDTVSDRDFVLEFLSAASICMMHLSRFSEELILWSTSEFGFIGLPDSFATGSSIMPQKKNPDVPELVRGKTGRVFGNLFAMLTTMKSLPLSYNRDMQEDKEPLFDSIDTLKACLEIYIKMLPKIEIKKQAMKKAANKGFLNATDLSDYLVEKGVSFRTAHEISGKLVSYAISKEKELHELSLEELQSFSELIGDDIYENLTLEQMTARRSVIGGTAKTNVLAAIKEAEMGLEAGFS